MFPIRRLHNGDFLRQLIFIALNSSYDRVNLREMLPKLSVTHKAHVHGEAEA